MFRPWIILLASWTLLFCARAEAQRTNVKNPSVRAILRIPDVSVRYQDAVQKFMKSGQAEQLSFEDAFLLLDECFFGYSASGVEEDLSSRERNARSIEWQVTTQQLAEIAWRKADQVGPQAMNAMVERTRSEQLNNAARYWIALYELKVAIENARHAKPVFKAVGIPKSLSESLPLEVIPSVQTFARLTQHCLTANLAKSPSGYGEKDWGTAALLMNDGVAAAKKRSEEIRNLHSAHPFSPHSMVRWFDEITTLTRLLREKQWEEAVGFILLTDFDLLGMDSKDRANQLVFSFLKSVEPDWEEAFLGREMLNLHLSENDAQFSLPGWRQPWQRHAASPSVVQNYLRWTKSAAESKHANLEDGLKQLLDLKDSPDWNVQTIRFREAPLPTELRNEAASQLAKLFLKSLEKLPPNPDDDYDVMWAIYRLNVAAAVKTPEMRDVVRVLARYPAEAVRKKAASTLAMWERELKKKSKAR